MTRIFIAFAILMMWSGITHSQIENGPDMGKPSVEIGRGKVLWKIRNTQSLKKKPKFEFTWRSSLPSARAEAALRNLPLFIVFT